MEHILHINQSVKVGNKSKTAQKPTVTLMVTSGNHSGVSHSGSVIQYLNMQLIKNQKINIKASSAVSRLMLQEVNTCSLFRPRKSLRSSVRGSRWLSSRIRFSARCSSNREFCPMKEFSARALILFLSSTSSRSWWSPSIPSTWLISLPR